MKLRWSKPSRLLQRIAFLVFDWNHFWLSLFFAFLWTLLSSIQKKKIEEKENLAVWERASSETRPLCGALIFKTMLHKQRQTKDPDLHPPCFQEQPLTTVVKSSILHVSKGPRSLSDIYDILISSILMSYLIYLNKKIWLLLKISPYDTIIF